MPKGKSGKSPELDVCIQFFGTTYANHGGFVLRWTDKDCKSGELSIAVSNKGYLECDSGNMPKSFVKKVLNKLIDDCRGFENVKKRRKV